MDWKEAMSTTPTPRTDEAFCGFETIDEARNFARQLERELEAMTKERDEWMKVASALMHDFNIIECESLHHGPEDDHSAFENCPVEARRIKALNDFDKLLLKTK